MGKRDRKIFCYDTHEMVYGYSNYLKTKHWHDLRIKVMKDRHDRCERCGRNVGGNFEVHHLTYKNIGREKLEDLKLLCGNCHEGTHLVLNMRKSKRPIHVNLNNVKLNAETNDKSPKRIVSIIE